MMCFTCKGNVEESTTEIYTLSLHDALPISLKKIETILEKLKTMLTEFAVVDYNKAA